MLNALIMFFLRILYGPRVKMTSLDEAVATGERVLLMPHYASYLDPVLFSLFTPYKTLLLATPSMTRTRLFKRLKSKIRHIEIDYNDPFALRHASDLWEKERCVILFPEPEPTTDGIFMKLHETAVAIAEKSDAWLVPARAVNAQFTPFSRLTRKIGMRLPRKTAIEITLATDVAEKVASPDDGGSKERKHAVELQIERLMRGVMMDTAWDRQPIFDSLLETRKLWGGGHIATMEPDGSRITWNGLITRIFVLRRVIEPLSAPGDRVGIMLPNSTSTLAAIFALQASGREPAMINYSMGSRSLAAACKIANVRQILTSSRFLEEGKFQPLADALSAEGIRIVLLEPLVEGLSTGQKLSCAWAALTAKSTPDAAKLGEAEKTALVLFTSGSEGTPKPVALSHLNIQANTAQVRMTLDFTANDVLLNIMPMFHSFGLCTGTFMPLEAGMPVAFYPTPLHYKKIPQYAYETRTTILLGTNAFLAGYAKNADDMDFFEMRYVVCGGDKLREGTAKLWQERFGIQVLEGYGVTEATPVIGVNTMCKNRFGSIGKPLPHIDCHIKPVEGVEEGGRLVVRGPNIMKGYIKEDGTILPPPEDGYDTGDIVTIDEDGYIFIKGRAKRFAKIGGEMISLAQVEEVVQEIWPDIPHAVVSVVDENRGEVIVLLTEKPDSDRDELRREMAAKGLPELAIPKKIIHVEALPRIGVGKTDYTTAARIAAEG